MYIYNELDAVRYCSFLRGSSDADCIFQVFVDRHKKEGHWLRGTIETHFEELCNLNERGYAICAQVHDGVTRGHKGVRSASEIFLDLDDIQPEQAVRDLTILPSLTIQTSPHKHHLYIRIDRTADLSLVDSVTVSLARMIGADDKACSRGQVARVPGFFNRKTEVPHCVQILDYRPLERYRLEDLAALVSNVPETAPRPRNRSRGAVRPSRMRAIFPAWDFAVLRSAFAKGCDRLKSPGPNRRHITIRAVGFHWGSLATVGFDAERSYQAGVRIIASHQWEDRSLTTDSALLRSAMAEGYQSACSTPPTPSTWTALNLELRATKWAAAETIRTVVQQQHAEGLLPTKILASEFLKDFDLLRHAEEHLGSRVAILQLNTALRAIGYTEQRSCYGRYLVLTPLTTNNP